MPSPRFESLKNIIQSPPKTRIDDFCDVNNDDGVVDLLLVYSFDSIYTHCFL